jgi:hypothetical protein
MDRSREHVAPTSLPSAADHNEGHRLTLMLVFERGCWKPRSSDGQSIPLGWRKTKGLSQSLQAGRRCCTDWAGGAAGRADVGGLPLL